MHCATHTLLVSCSRFNYGFGVSFAISSRVPSHSWAQLSQGLSTKSPLPSSPSSMSSAPLSVPFNLFCQLVRHSASVRRALLHFFFFFFLLIVVAAAELSPLFLGLFSTFSLRLFGLLRHFEGRPPRSVCARARCPRPSSRRLSVRSTVAACNHPPCVAHAFVSMLSCLQFLLAPPSLLLSRWPLARPPSPNCISFR